MKVLVTGATGFMGTRLCKILTDKGHNITALGSQKCDLTVEGSLSFLSTTKFDQIFHLAAWTQAGDFCLHHPGEQWMINQNINTNVLCWWHKEQSQAKLIFMGTSCSYPTNLQLEEANYLDGTPTESLFTYAMTKRMLLVGAMALAKQYDMKYLCLVPSTLYGSGYHTDGRQMHFIFDLVRKILRAHFYGEEVVLWGDGYQTRELVYLDDFIKIMLQLNDNSENEIINIGAGKEFSIRKFAEIICEIVGFDGEKIKYDTDRYVGAKSKCLDIKKLKKIMPDLAYTQLKDGMEELVNWFIQSQAYDNKAK